MPTKPALLGLTFGITLVSMALFPPRAWAPPMEVYRPPEYRPEYHPDNQPGKRPDVYDPSRPARDRWELPQRKTDPFADWKKSLPDHKSVEPATKQPEAPLATGKPSERDAARLARAFKVDHTGSTLIAARSVLGHKATSGWLYVKTDTQHLPGLLRDGSADPAHPIAVTSLLLSDGNSLDTSFYYRNPVTHKLYGAEVSDALGVDLSATSLTAKLRASRFAVVEHDDSFAEDGALAATAPRVILLSRADIPRSGDYQRFRIVNEAAADALPPKLKALIDANVLVVAAANVGTDTMAVLYGATTLVSKHSGVALNLTNGAAGRDALMRELEAIKAKGGTVYVYGDNDPSQSVVTAAARTGTSVVRRSVTIKKNVLDATRAIAATRNGLSDPARTALVNAVPGSEQELRQMSLPSSGADSWRKVRAGVESSMIRRFATRISSKREFVRLLEHDELDAVVIVAHAERAFFYIGGERITKAELNSLANRESKGRPRIAILASCSAGRLSEGRRRLLGQELQSLAEIMVNKNFFDVVVAPDHDISSKETLEVLQQLLTGSDVQTVRTQHPGWFEIAARRLQGGHAWEGDSDIIS